LEKEIFESQTKEQECINEMRKMSLSMNGYVSEMKKLTVHLLMQNNRLLQLNDPEMDLKIASLKAKYAK
jgi:hypothetical protein